MKPPYRIELDALSETYEQALRAEIEPVRRALESIGSGPALFIGSGGSMAVAELAAYLHERRCRQPARACTSLEALDAPQLSRRGALLFSSSAKHPDAQRVLDDFRRRRFAPAVLATHRAADEIQAMAGQDTIVVTLPSLTQPDGFLATGSILQLATLVLRAHLQDSVLAPSLSEPASGEAPLRDEILVLVPPSLRCVATDIEVRLVESGLAAVQVADYRNFAHGRHTGFSRRGSDVSVIALSDRDSDGLAAGTVELLPDCFDVRRWHVDEPWPKAVITLLYRSMCLARDAGERVGLDVARPRVPAFGRRLYRLPLSRRVPARLVGGIERKLLAGAGGDTDDVRRSYEDASATWREQLLAERFAGVVLDYDGTVCWTQRRFELPEVEMRDRLRAILDDGALLGFASGRGRSLHADLRQWVPERQWDRVIVGLYNGGVVCNLTEDLPDLREPTAWSHSAIAAIRALPNAERWEIVERGAQVSISGIGATDQAILATLVCDRLMSAGVQAIVTASGHSVDVIPATSTKLAVVDRVEEQAGGIALAIGDQGQLGGNDHALLARGPFTLSVDRCSADPGSCWFVGAGDRVGPALLARHLQFLRPRLGGLALTGVEVI
jgi:hydroxymethylpyrimidine pyrophosphatase-like HAD family hydrolase